VEREGAAALPMAVDLRLRRGRSRQYEDGKPCHSPHSTRRLLFQHLLLALHGVLYGNAYTPLSLAWLGSFLV
jgi:hypothetical protein